MSTFRVNKNVNYTVMSNHHLQDKRLSLKAKGLLSYMLSLPDDWGLQPERADNRVQGWHRQCEKCGSRTGRWRVSVSEQSP